MALSPLFSIGRRALFANETALAVTGNNIANVNTPGYTRQVPEFTEDLPVVTGLGILVGSGVHVASVSQVLDPLLARRQLAAETERGEQGALSDELGALAGILSELDTPSIGSALSGFFDAADALARNPQGLAERETLLARATALARELNGRSAAIASQQRAIDGRYVEAATHAGDLQRQIADLNRQIVGSETSGQRANDLRDQRAAALQELSGLLRISTVEQANGLVTVSAANGLGLVDGGEVTNPIVVRQSGVGLDGLPLHEAGIADAAGGFIAVPEAFASGELGGLAEARDTQLVAASGALDTFALALSGEVNNIQQDPAALDLDGNPTAAVPLFGGTGAADLAVVITDPHQIGAALSAQPGDNQNALRLADLRTTPVAALGNASFTAYLGAEQAAVAEDAARAGDAAAAAAALSQQIENQRAAVSGVNLNEELTNLLKYQRAFQAASRMIGIADQLLGDLFEAF
jgi:flagellar hook-associated protein 1 FlgK